jgi:hypothetical protein
MGASAQRPTSGAPGAGGSGFYQNALNQQKQAVSGEQSARGFQKVPDTASRELDAYNQYMQAQQQRMDYDTKMKAQQQGMDTQVRQDANQSYDQRMQAQQQRMDYDTKMKAQQQRMDAQAQQQRNSAPRRGITMGAGYANRPFG